MTVIACNLKRMAADSLVVVGTEHFFAHKIFRLDDGSIVGGAGIGSEPIIDWLKRGTPRSDAPAIGEKDNFEVLHLRRDGIWLFCNSTIAEKLKDKTYAVGCGGAIALYAMRKLKRSPETACKAAIEMNLFCGGDIDVLSLY